MPESETALFLKADTSTTAGTSQVPVTLLISNKTDPSSEVASVNAILVLHAGIFFNKLNLLDILL